MRRRILIAAFLATVAFFAAHLINLMVAHALTKRITTPGVAGAAETRLVSQVDRRRLIDEILASGLFGSRKISPGMAALGTGGSPYGSTSATQGPPIDAAKKVKLIGTVSGDTAVSRAVLEDIGSKKQSLYHLHEIIPAVGEIAEIRRNAILIVQGGQREVLELSNGLPTPQPSAAQAPMPPLAGFGLSSPRILDRREVAQSMADLPKLLSQARATAFYANGKQEGWRIESLAPQSFYEKIGLKSGDVLQRLNGTELRDPGMLLAFFQQVKDERTVTLDLLREDRKATLIYELR
ncbi:MAG TPA: hypothetical protein VJ692_16135 [Nitrospiraceae bacterium]|nr:hypothetical protein [Nitrospiraceae bacterium]